MFNRQLSGMNKSSSLEMELEADDTHLTQPGREAGFKLYHPKRHLKLKIITAIFAFVGCIGVSFVAGLTLGAVEAGKSQSVAEDQNAALFSTRGFSLWGGDDDAEDETADVGYGGYCAQCSENSGSRGWSWWFGWGACPCHDGWKGACCDVPFEAVDGGFSDWSEPGPCSVACGTGVAELTRTCDNPKPKNGGKPCLGGFTMQETCHPSPCAEGKPLFGWKEIAEAEAAAFSFNIGVTINDVWDKGLCWVMQTTDKVQAAFFNSMGSTIMYEGVNFVRGFDFWGSGSWASFGREFFQEPRWVAPVEGEQITIKPYSEVTKGGDYGQDFMNRYYTADKNPSWEEDRGHDRAIAMITGSLENADTTCLTHGLEPRFPFDHDMLMETAWKGFTWFDYNEIKYASNGDFGYHLLNARMEEFDTRDTLGLLMTDSVFSIHLTYNEATDTFHLDLTDMEQFESLPGYAALGGQATFKFDNSKGKYGRLVTQTITYGGKTYDENDFVDPAVIEAFEDSRLIGWMFAEKCIMSSLLSQTNLILHVKGLHLELAAAFQGVTIAAFKTNVNHPVRRLLDQFTHRSVQATNGNFDLLFEGLAAEFSLAPLPYQEQLRMIAWYIDNKPLSMATLSMPEFAEQQNMAKFSQRPTMDANGRPDKFFWRWHYRARLAQEMYVDLIDCWIEQNGGWEATMNDSMVQGWWDDMKSYLPCMNQAVTQHGDWISNGQLTRESFTRVTSTIMVWVSHIHEDVGHSAAYVVYNPVHTPMQVPEDGVGIPLNSFAFNTNAYRTFVFLERAKLLEEPAEFWFNDGKTDKQCYTTMQDTYRGYGQTDDTFSECGETGFYSCVEAVETSVSS